METTQRIEKLRAWLSDQNLDAAYISSYENRRYFSEFTGSNGYLIITPSELVLITDQRYTLQATQQADGYKVVTHLLDPLPTIKDAIDSLSIRTLAYETRKLTDFDIRGYRSALPHIDWVPMEDIGKQLRAVKDAGEQEKLRQAIAIADRAVARLVNIIQPGMTEKEVAIELEYCLAKEGSEGPAFGTIVASGVRGSLPHGGPTDKRIEAGEMVVVDCGAIFQGYHSDITRTIWVGEPTDKMLEIYNIVAEAQKQAFSVIKPGITGGDIDRAHRTVFEQAGVEQYSLRGLGHGVGLEIHEQPRVVIGSQEIIQPGMIFTVEPGLYLPEIGGVRIEDIVLVTENGCEVLTACPQTLRVEIGAA